LQKEGFVLARDATFLLSANQSIETAAAGGGGWEMP
jgi:hypothetical protein